MRGTASADLAAFHKVDARSAGFHAHVAAGSQDGFHLALDDLDAHGSGDTNGFAFNDAHRIGKWFIGARSSRGDQRSAEDGQAGRGKLAATSARDQIGKGRHSLIVQATEAESLAYTLRRVICSRVKMMMTTPYAA